MKRAMAEPDPPEAGVVHERLRAALTVAGEVRTGVPVEDLSDLLPDGAPEGASQITEYIGRHPPLGQVFQGVAFPPDVGPLLPSTRERQERGQAYIRAATELVERRLAAVRPLLACAVVTGSTAYGEPEKGDDCDVFAITRPGTMWAFLTYLYLRLRLTRHRDASEPPVWCFNFVLEADAAERTFARPQGFLFAREALMARPVSGSNFYRGLLGTAPWLKEEAPRLFARWEEEGIPAPQVARRAALPLRVLNFALFPMLAVYLQLVGLYRNHALRRTGRDEECFTTRTLPDGLMVLSDRFSRLTQVYSPSTIVRTVTQEA